MSPRKPAKKQPRLRRGMMMRLPISSLQILFLTWVTSIEHYWVTLRKRRGFLSHNAIGHSLHWAFHADFRVLRSACSSRDRESVMRGLVPGGTLHLRMDFAVAWF